MPLWYLCWLFISLTDIFKFWLSHNIYQSSCSSALFLPLSHDISQSSCVLPYFRTLAHDIYQSSCSFPHIFILIKTKSSRLSIYQGRTTAFYKILFINSVCLSGMNTFYTFQVCFSGFFSWDCLITFKEITIIFECFFNYIWTYIINS